MTLAARNDTAQPVTVRVLNKYTRSSDQFVLAPGASTSSHSAVSRFYGWYNLVVTVVEDASFEYQLAGHVENGKDSMSDPLMGGLI